MRRRSRKHRRGQTLPGDMMSREELAARSEELKAQAIRIFLLLERRAGHTIDWSQVEGGRPANADEILAARKVEPVAGGNVVRP